MALREILAMLQLLTVNIKEEGRVKNRNGQSEEGRHPARFSERLPLEAGAAILEMI